MVLSCGSFRVAAMEITTDTAALFAQIIPTLLIVVALEPKFRGEGMEPRTALARWMMRGGRQTAAVSSGVSILFCLYVVLADSPNGPITWFVYLSTGWLIIVMMALFAAMFVDEDERTEGGREAHQDVTPV